MILECVPNFSEGRRPDVVEAIARSAEIPGVRVLGSYGRRSQPFGDDGRGRS